MKYRYIPSCVMLVAGLITCILCIVQGWPVDTSLVALVIVLVLFYIIGQIAAQVVGKVQADRIAMEEAERKLAAEMIDSGKANEKLEQFIAYTNVK